MVFGDCLVLFLECLIVGCEVDSGEIEFLFLWGVELCEFFIDWMLYWGIFFWVMV